MLLRRWAKKCSLPKSLQAEAGRGLSDESAFVDRLIGTSSTLVLRAEARYIADHVLSRAHAIEFGTGLGRSSQADRQRANRTARTEAHRSICGIDHQHTCKEHKRLSLEA